MFRSWKSAIGRAGELLNDESTYSTENPQHVAPAEAGRDSSPLGRLLDDLKASEARRNGQRPNPEPETAPATVPQAVAPATVPQAVAPATVPQAVAPATVPQAVAPVTASPTAKVETAMSNDVQPTPAASNGAFNGAQRLIADQRKAAEALLFEV